MAAHDLVVIGASAGGVDAIQRLAATLPADFPAAILITLHLHGSSEDFLPNLLNKAGPLPAAHGRDGEEIRPGFIYIAPPDYHLLVDDSHLHLSHGPRENLQRPSINAMFRSAAHAYRDRVTGVLLTGLLDDGAAGLWEIQQQNGATIAQDPLEAPYPSMPQSAIRNVNVQYIVRIDEIAPILVRLATRNGHRKSPPIPDEPVEESTGQACPECGGAMTKSRLGNLIDYRCHTGHRFGLESLIAEKSSVIERSLGAALAHSEELTELLSIAASEAEPGRADEMQQEIAQRKKEQQTLRTLTGISHSSQALP